MPLSPTVGLYGPVGEDYAVGSFNSRKPNPTTDCSIPEFLLAQFRVALESLSQLKEEKSSAGMSEEIQKALSSILEALVKLCDPPQTPTPELQIQAVSRITGVIKETAMGDTIKEKKLSPAEYNIANILAYEFAVPALLDYRIRYLHRGISTLLRAIWRKSALGLNIIEERFLNSIAMLFSSFKSADNGKDKNEEMPPLEKLDSRKRAFEGFSYPSVDEVVRTTLPLGPEQMSMRVECYGYSVMKFLNTIDCLSSTLLTLVPSVFEGTFYQVFPLLGNSLDWCVRHALGSTGLGSEINHYEQNRENKDSVTLLGKDLEQIRFCVRIVASYVHKYLAQLRNISTSILAPQFSRLIAPAMMMLSSSRFPKDVLNATGLLMASLITAKDCSAPFLKVVCSSICSIEKWSSDVLPSSFSAKEKAWALETAVLCFCSSSDELLLIMNNNANRVPESIQLFFSELTTHGCFALLKGMLAHFTSPIHGKKDTITLLLRPIPCDSSSSRTIHILYDLIQPITLIFSKATDLPETRFMAIQTLDAMIRHVDGVLRQVHDTAVEFHSSFLSSDSGALTEDQSNGSNGISQLFRIEEHQESSVHKLWEECFAPEQIHNLCNAAMETMMEVWDDTSQVSGAVCGTFHVLLSIHKVMEGLSSHLFRNEHNLFLPSLLTEHPLNPNSGKRKNGLWIPMNTVETLLSVLSISSGRRSKYHALLDLMSWMSCGEFFAGLLFYFFREKYFSKDSNSPIHDKDEERTSTCFLDDLVQSTQMFSLLLLNAGSNLKVASAAGDTAAKFVEKLMKDERRIKQNAPETKLTGKGLRWIDTRTVGYDLVHLSHFRSVIVSSIARAMTTAETVRSGSFNISESTHISIISAHFVCPLMKVDKVLLDELLSTMTEGTSLLSPCANDWERLSQSIIEVIRRAQGVGMDIQEYLQPGSKIFPFVIESLQSFRFDQRIAALQMCILLPKKVDPVTALQTTILYRFLAINMHFGGDTAGRKTLIDTFRKWINRVMDSYNRLSANKAAYKIRTLKENEKNPMIDSDLYASSVVVPHLTALTHLFVINMGKTIAASRRLSVERKVTACLLLTVLLESLSRNDRIAPLVLDSSFPLHHLVSLLTFHLSDGWSQMRLAAKTLLQSLVGTIKDKCLRCLMNDGEETSCKDGSTQLGSVLKQIRSAITFRAAEGAVQHYMFIRDFENSNLSTVLKADHHHKGIIKSLFSELEQNFQEVNIVCEAIKSQSTKELYQTVVHRPLHGMLSLCTELFVSLQAHIKISLQAHAKTTETSADVSNFAVEAANRLLHLCATVICTCGALAGQETLSTTKKLVKEIEDEEDIVVDCRGHVYDRFHEESEGLMRLVVNNTWLSIRMTSFCLQRVVLLIEATSFDLKSVKRVCDELVHVLLITKHNGVMRSVRAALTVLMEVLLRCRAVAYQSLPSELLGFLLGPDGVSSEDPSRMLRRSQGLPHALLAVLEAEDDRAPLVLFPVAMRELLAFSERQKGNGSAVRLSQRSNALNVLKFIFENKRFAERMLPYAEAAFAIATDGFDDANWGIRNSSLMLFAAVLPRLIGQSMGTAAGGGAHTSLSDALKRTPHCIKYAYTELCKSIERESLDCSISNDRLEGSSGEEAPLVPFTNEAELQQDLRVLPVLQMFSMFTPDPVFRLKETSFLYPVTSLGLTNKLKFPKPVDHDEPRIWGENELINVVRLCGTSKNLMIRAACAVALPCILASSSVVGFIYSLPDFLCKEWRSSFYFLRENTQKIAYPASVRPKINTIHGVLLQLQQIHCRYFGTFEKNWRALQSCCGTPEVAVDIRNAIVSTLDLCQKHFEAASQCCPTVFSAWLNLLSDMLFFAPPLGGSGGPCMQDIKKYVISGVCLVARMILPRSCRLNYASIFSDSSLPSMTYTGFPSCFSMFSWCRADWTSAMNAASRFLILALRMRDMWDESTKVALKQLGYALSALLADGDTGSGDCSTSGNDSSHLPSFSSLLCHTFHKLITGKCINVDEMVDSIGRLEVEANYSLPKCALHALKEGLCSHSTAEQRSWQIVAQSDYLEFLSDLLLVNQFSVPSFMCQNLLQALYHQTNSSHHYPSWCGAGLRFLSLLCQKGENSLDSKLVFLLQYFGDPKRGQTMRMATLEALELLLPKASCVLQSILQSNFSLSLEEVSSASSLLILLLQFLVDDTQDVREKACKAWKCVVPGSQIVKDQCSCLMSIILSLHILVKAFPESKESVKRALLALRDCTASIEIEDDNDDEEVLFYKESDNMFFEETLLEELVSFVARDESQEGNVLLSDQTTAQLNFGEYSASHWPGLYEMLCESEKSKSLLLRLFSLC